MIDQIKASGATLVALSPQLSEHNKKMVDQHKLDFDILTDKGNAYAASLGLSFKVPEDVAQIYLGFGIDLPACNGEDSWTLPMPGRIVVDSSGVVRDTDVDPDYTARPEPQATIDALKAL